jgi:hypothetical protein
LQTTTPIMAPATPTILLSDVLAQTKRVEPLRNLVATEKKPEEMTKKMELRSYKNIIIEPPDF